MQKKADNLFWDQLLTLIEEGRVVPIVGRDLLTVCSDNHTTLLYPLVAQQLADYLEVSREHLPEGDEINTVVYRYLRKGKRIEDIYPALKMKMPAEKELSIPEPLIKLAKIPPLKLFVTTTFDSLLERAINQVRFGGHTKTKVYSYAPNTVEDLPGSIKSIKELATPVVFHLFGKLSAIPSYAVTQEDMLEFLHSLQSESRQPRVLFDELNRTNLMILGCNFGDWLGRFFIRTAKHQRLLEARGSTDYLVDARMSIDRSLVLFLKHYSSRTRIYDEMGAVDFIDELYKRWSNRHPPSSGGIPPLPPDSPPDPTTRIASVTVYKTSGSVFLSYASEDIQPVMKIRDALESEGIDVFFDKDRLQPGEDFEMKLKRTINECALFIPVISKNTLTEHRRSFRIEWNLALEEALKVAPTERFIVPVVIDDTQSTAEALPVTFRKLHWEKLPEGDPTSRFVSMIKELYRKYQKAVGGAL